MLIQKIDTKKKKMRISKNIKTDSYGIQFFFSNILKKEKEKKKNHSLILF